MTYDRYSKFRSNGTIELVPTIKIRQNDSDYFVTYEANKTSLNKLSYDYYGDANYDWLILMANPQYGSMEYSIPNGAQLRIPFPLDKTIENYSKDVDNYKRLYK